MIKNTSGSNVAALVAKFQAQQSTTTPTTPDKFKEKINIGVQPQAFNASRTVLQQSLNIKKMPQTKEGLNADIYPTGNKPSAKAIVAPSPISGSVLSSTESIASQEVTISQQQKLFTAAKNKDSAQVKSLLEHGLIPNCQGIHKTCSENKHKDVKTSDAAQAVIETETDIIKKLKFALIKQLEINKQQGDEIEYLNLTLDEFTAHLFIISMQREIALQIATQRETEIEKQATLTAAMKAEATQKHEELIRQQQAAEVERQRQAQQLASERIEAARKQAEAIAAAERAAQARVAAENAKIDARLELDQPFGGPHQKSHGQRRLHIAVLENNPAEVTRLINAGATVDVTDSFNHTPLWYAVCQIKSPACIHALIAGGATITPAIQATLASQGRANGTPHTHLPRPIMHRPPTPVIPPRPPGPVIHQHRSATHQPRPMVHPLVHHTPIPSGHITSIKTKRATKKGKG